MVRADSNFISDAITGNDDNFVIVALASKLYSDVKSLWNFPA